MARTATMTLSQGRVVKLAMPNIYQVLTGSGVPNPPLAAVLKLLDGDGLLAPQNPIQQLHSARDNIRALYEIAHLCLVEPRLILDQRELVEGEIGPQDLAFGDLHLIYYSFFRNDPITGSPDADDREPRESASTAPGVNGVSHEAVEPVGNF